ncbi:MAG: cob(I)yrinic acid a,c-diamide adenosyltransferase [Lachnospiraceae bacterium]|nr:cob(I)yrinic acid a,c-diamide adenosyltransferase [Lachnospiraceae bacterium]
MGKIQIYAGKGHGKSPAGLGEAMMAAAAGKHVVIIQFLKGKGITESGFERRLEPELKIFRFEKSDCDFCKLPEEKQKEECRNIKNGLNFARKVLMTGECDLLVLDEVLGLIDNGIIEEQELKTVLAAAGEDTNIVLTGISLNDSIGEMADMISCIERIK